MNHKVLYKEEQRFNQRFIWVILALLLLIPVYGIIQQIIFKIPFGSRPMSDLGLILLLIGMLGLSYFFLMLRLNTAITSKEITIHFKPLLKKRIPWSEVDQAQIVKYSPLIGYGVRIWTPYGTVYNVRGNHGLGLTLKNGKKYMIGTQNHRELEDVVQSIMK